MTNFKAVDAFCGAGGLSLGLQNAGIDIVLGFDLDPLCIKTLSSNPDFIPHPAVQADVSEMLAGGLLNLTGLKPGELDLLAGGPPCQGFSVQRTVGDDADDRNMLVNDYGDLIAEVLPKFFLLENVPGLGGKRGRAVLELFIQKMESLGYRVHSNTLNAQDFGVPQRRRRMIVVGELTRGSDGFFKWPSPNSGVPPTVRDTISHLPPAPGDGSEHPGYPGHRADRLSEKNKQRILAITEGQGRTHLPSELLADCHKMSADLVGHRNVYGRMTWDEVAPTITARFDSFTRGKFGHPDQTRSISLLEGALLQTFPEKYRFSGNKVDVARQIGNAVPPKLGFAIGQAIQRALLASKRSAL